MKNLILIFACYPPFKCHYYTSDSGDTDKPAKKDDIHAPPKNIGDVKLQEKVRNCYNAAMICMSVCTGMFVHLDVCMCVSMCIHMYDTINVCMHIHTYII